MTAGAIGWSTKNIFWKALWLILTGAIPGILVGTFLYFPTVDVIKTAFALISVIAAFAILIEMKSGVVVNREEMAPQSHAYKASFVIISFLAGVVNAWVATAIGEFVVLWLL